MDQAAAEKRVGTTLCSKWTLERLLGVGGMAAVYASAHKIGRRDAIKILHPDVARITDLRARFEQEAHVANRFKHPGAVEIRDIDKTEDGCPFLVMELLEGESLSDKARAGPVDLADVLRWTEELLDVLAAAHTQGIIHRDIKLDNLFITREGKLKVLDFGIARVRSGGPSAWKTQIGATLGTAPYMPPEQVAGRDIDGRADLFAVGATMFRLIARRRIHDADNEATMLAKMATQPAPPLATVCDAPQNVCLVVDRALRFRREDRYPDAATMQGDVRTVRAGQEPPHATQRYLTDVSQRSGPMAAGPASPVPQHIANQAMAARVIVDGPTRADTATAAAPLSQAQAQMAATMMTSAASPVSMQASQASVPFPLVGRPDATVPGATASALMAAAGVPLSVREATLGATNAGGMPPSAAAPLNGAGTLKSAHVVPLPGAGPDGGPFSRPVNVAIAQPPAATPPWKNRQNQLIAAVGGGCLLLGIGLTVVMCSDDDKRPRGRGADAAFNAPTAQGAAPEPSSSARENSPSSSSNSNDNKNDQRSNNSNNSNNSGNSSNNSSSNERSSDDKPKGEEKAPKSDDKGSKGGGKGNKGGKGKKH